MSDDQSSIAASGPAARSGSGPTFGAPEFPLGVAADAARALFEQSPFSTVLYDTAGRVLAVNAAFEHLFGLTVDVIPADYSVLTDPQLESAGHLPIVRRAFEGETAILPPVFYDAVLLDGAGRQSWTQGHFFPMRDRTGTVSGVVLVHVDLTERMVADEARRLSEERLRVALDAGGMGAWEWDVVSGRVHWSDTLQRIHGLVPGSFRGTFEEYQADIHPEDRERVLAQIAHSLDGGTHELEYRIIRPDGALRWLEARGELFRDADGRPSRMLGVCTDVTERKLADEERDRVRRLLEKQAGELELQTQLLQTQAMELEEQQIELEQQTEELQVTNEELHRSNDALTAAHEASARAEAYTRGILGSIGDPFVVHDDEWRFRYVNAAAASIFAESGIPNADRPDALLGRIVWNVYPDLVGTAMEREMRRARDQGIALTFTEFYARTGRWSEMRCYPMPGRGLATLWRDVTEQKRSEEARHYLGLAGDILARSLDRDETARELAGLLVPQLADWCSIELLDAAGALRQVSVAHVDPAKVVWAAALHERYPADPTAKTGSHEVVRTGQPMLYPDIPDALLVAAARDDEHLRILRDIGFASALTVPLIARGETIGAMSLVSAESGRRYGDAELELAGEIATRAALAFDNAALYAEAVKARCEAESANKSKSEFLATMSHELRTPLNAIGGYAQLIEMGVHGPVTDTQREALRRVQRSQQHLLSLVNDVLNFAKLEAGRVVYDIERVPLREILAGLESLVAPQLAEKELSFACLPCDVAVGVAADPEKLQQILLNLLSNAIKFTSPGGAIRVDWSAEADRVYVNVSDTGIGIPTDRLEAVFEPFVQLATGGAWRNGGTGLGLSISRDLARAMSGDLTIESRPERGSTFTLVLPRR
ncbi:MAG TPA: PAS domain-containing protein [Gemmatimonas sp.]|nr:PAS domain-containing protein [Gemmatimonas sp.]